MTTKVESSRVKKEEVDTEEDKEKQEKDMVKAIIISLIVGRKTT